jgi:hypothetical protein
MNIVFGLAIALVSIISMAVTAGLLMGLPLLIYGSEGMLIWWMSIPLAFVFVLLLGLISAVFAYRYFFAKAIDIEGNIGGELKITIAKSLVFGSFGVVALGGFAYSGGLLWDERPVSASFKQACLGSGPFYFEKPTKPVASLAYELTPGTNLPEYESFVTKGNGIVLRKVARDPEHWRLAGLEFIERPVEVNRGMRERNTYVVQKQGSKDTEKSEQITADALVRYFKATTTGSSDKKGVHLVQIEVSDRRDGRRLAVLKYVFDEENNKFCGLTLRDTMNEKDFIGQAIGLY